MRPPVRHSKPGPPRSEAPRGAPREKPLRSALPRSAGWRHSCTAAHRFQSNPGREPVRPQNSMICAFSMSSSHIRVTSVSSLMRTAFLSPMIQGGCLRMRLQGSTEPRALASARRHRTQMILQAPATETLPASGVWSPMNSSYAGTFAAARCSIGTNLRSS